MSSPLILTTGTPKKRNFQAKSEHTVKQLKALYIPADFSHFALPSQEQQMEICSTSLWDNDLIQVESISLYQEQTAINKTKRWNCSFLSVSGWVGKRKKICSASPWNTSERFHFSYFSKSNKLPAKAPRGAPNSGILYIPCFILGFLMCFSNSKSCVYREDSEGWACRQSSLNSANKQHFSSSLPRIKSYLGQGKSQCSLKWVRWHRNLHLLTGGFKIWIISCK